MTESNEAEVIWTAEDEARLDEALARRAARRAAAPQAQPSESAWLVEHRLAETGLPFGPAWSCVEHGRLTASTDPSKALRFARREDAEAFATTERDPMFPGTVVATEHKWPQVQPAPAAVFEACPCGTLGRWKTPDALARSPEPGSIDPAGLFTDNPIV